MIGAVAAAVAVCAIVAAFVAMAFAMRNAERERGAALTDGARKDGEIAIAHATIKTERDRGDTEERRADALDSELDQVALDGDAGGARGRVLSRYRRKAGIALPAPGDSAGPVHVEPTANSVGVVGRNGLERPGD